MKVEGNTKFKKLEILASKTKMEGKFKKLIWRQIEKKKKGGKFEKLIWREIEKKWEQEV